MSDIKRIIVTIEGGVVTAVIAETDGKAQPRLPVTIIDYDTEGADRDELSPVPQSDGPEVLAFVGHWWSDSSEIAFPAHRDPREG